MSDNSVSLTIRVNWGAIPNYQYRLATCPLPSQMPQLPSNQVCNAPNENNLNKGIVRVNITLVNAESCTLAKNYETRQYYIQQGNDDIIAEVPKRSIVIQLSYYEACSNCTTTVPGNSRALYRSETIVPEGQVNSGAIIQLNTPMFFAGASCN